MSSEAVGYMQRLPEKAVDPIARILVRSYLFYISPMNVCVCFLEHHSVGNELFQS